jgi:hypothetical protein
MQELNGSSLQAAAKRLLTLEPGKQVFVRASDCTTFAGVLMRRSRNPATPCSHDSQLSFGFERVIVRYGWIV